MKLTFDIILACDLEDGDIFYCTPNFDLNEFGPAFLITGTDQIFITDDFNDSDDLGNTSVIVNGGHVIWFTENEKVVKIGHYRDFIRVIEMIKIGNPEMAIGPNDSGTLIDELMAANPQFKNTLLDDLDIEFKVDEEE